jgi:hypothetical protein
MYCEINSTRAGRSLLAFDPIPKWGESELKKPS